MQKFSWELSEGGNISRYPHPGGDCHPAFFRPCDLSPFHDEKLAAATEDLNKRISQITEQMPDGRDEQGRTLHIIGVPEGVLLVWAFEARVSSSNDDQDIEEALRLER